MPPRPSACFLALAAALVAAGCGGPRPTGVTVPGEVTLDGAPLTAGTVYLIGLDETTARNTDVQKDGTFKFLDVPVGTYKVLVKDLVDAPVEYDAKGRGISRPRPKAAVPPKYQEFGRTPFQFEITPDTKLTLPLQSK